VGLGLRPFLNALPKSDRAPFFAKYLDAIGQRIRRAGTAEYSSHSGDCS
jgi:hypothetical protein